VSAEKRWTPESWADRPERKIAIVGFTDSRFDAPFKDSTWELWGLNNLHRQTELDAMKSFSRWYDLHDLATIKSDEAHVAWLTTATIPVYVWRVQPEWATTVEFPRDEVINEFGSYFTNSISYMIAHAMLEGATEIGVYGVDMAQGGEYSAQRPSCEYFLGLAAGHGITITIAETSDLLRCAVLYGDTDNGLRSKLEHRSKELSARIEAVRADMEQKQQMLLQLVGARESNDYILGVWTQPSAKRDATSSGLSDPNLPSLTT